ncbi:hypothetical protein [Microbacterium sp. A1-JK]|uniref:hypothetical protein n=1 Tax=Microbacterium sp. A1-JK TaxID=3177516 RepID=UPI003886CE55
MPAERIAKSLSTELQRQSYTFKEARLLHRNGKLTSRGLHTVVEATFLSSYASFEAFVEDLFYDCVLGTSGLPDSVPIADLQNRELAESILTLNRPFVKWLPWDVGVGSLASILLQESGPFARMARSVTEKGQLDEARLLRNAIAHNSGAAKMAVRDRISQLPARRRTVGWYLLASPMAGVTRYETHLANLEAISKCVTALSVVDGHKVLVDERPYASGQAAPRGSYLCERSNHPHRIIRSHQILPICGLCHNAQKSRWSPAW